MPVTVLERTLIIDTDFDVFTFLWLANVNDFVAKPITSVNKYENMKDGETRKG